MRSPFERKDCVPRFVPFAPIGCGNAPLFEGKVSVPRSVPFAPIIMCGCDAQVTSSSATIMASKPFAIILIFRFMVCSLRL